MTDAPPGIPTPPPRSPFPFVLFLILGMMLLFFFGWYRDWFGRDLTDAQVLERLAETEDPRTLQHALVQLEARLSPQFPAREKFRGPVVTLAKHPRHEVRELVAWVMGREPAPEYQAALRGMLSDDSLATRRNAACSLSNFKDGSARPVLLEALKHLAVVAPGGGVLELSTKVGDPASMGRDLGSIVAPGGQTFPLRAAFNGEIREVNAKDGATVSAGDVLLVVSPEPKSVLNVLHALQSVGIQADIETLRPFADGRVAGMSREVSAQAQKTIAAIQSR